MTPSHLLKSWNLLFQDCPGSCAHAWHNQCTRARVVHITYQSPKLMGVDTISLTGSGDERDAPPRTRWGIVLEEGGFRVCKITGVHDKVREWSLPWPWPWPASVEPSLMPFLECAILFLSFPLCQNTFLPVPACWATPHPDELWGPGPHHYRESPLCFLCAPTCWALILNWESLVMWCDFLFLGLSPSLNVSPRGWWLWYLSL